MRRKILIGDKFGKLTVISLQEKRKRKNGSALIWKCKCDCGNNSNVFGSALSSGHTKSCGCLMYQYNRGKNNYMWKGKGDISARFFQGIKGNARHRKIRFDLNIDHLWKLFIKQKKKCALTGKPLSFGKNSKDQSNTTASVDRIDSKGWYRKNNIRWVHKIINEMKFNLPQSQFLYYCYLVVNPIKDRTACGIEDEKCQKNGRWKGYKNISLTYWNSVLRHAERRNIPVKLTIKQAWLIFKKQNGRCVITGLPLKWGYKSKQTASLDRIDSDKEYDVDNVQWIHKDINNKLKKNLKEEELKKWCRAICNYNDLYLNYSNCNNCHKARECPIYEV